MDGLPKLEIHPGFSDCNYAVIQDDTDELIGVLLLKCAIEASYEFVPNQPLYITRENMSNYPFTECFERMKMELGHMYTKICHLINKRRNELKWIKKHSNQFWLIFVVFILYFALGGEIKNIPFGSSMFIES